MRFDNLQDWLVWLESCHPKDIDLGLDRISAVAAKLGFDFSGVKVVTVAGTNGKGSCVAAMDSLLRSSGQRVACYTSPHFLDYNERVVINGVAVDDSALVASFDRIDQQRGETSLSYFEFGTLAALDIFSRSELDVVLLEVGLGGRLDAVNIVEPDVAVVTSIDIDHSAWLGNDREQIGAEKAGIFRAGKPAICGDKNPPAVITERVREIGAQYYQRGIEFDITESDCGSFSWRGVGCDDESVCLDGLALPQLPLDSVVTALQAIHLLGFSLAPGAIEKLAVLSLPGRFQRLSYEGHQLILDVAHNPAAAAHLALHLQQEECSGRTLALFGIMADKDIPAVVSALKPCIHAWFVGDLKNNDRAIAAADLATLIGGQDIAMISVSKNLRQGLRRALSIMAPDDRLVVLGSFFTVAEIMKLVKRGSNKSGETDG